ncbi:RNA-directed DNA polymerase, eukaryota, reverse transcriptase zinc-binding domain protein [Tanacetum coccineum]
MKKKSSSPIVNAPRHLARFRKKDIKGVTLFHGSLIKLLMLGTHLVMMLELWNEEKKKNAPVAQKLCGVILLLDYVGSMDQVSKLALWNRLQDFMHHHNGSYIMFGDMNAVRNEQERVGSIFNNIEADYFNSFIDATGLVDLPIGGRCFTWMNKADTAIGLDGFDDLIKSEWDSLDSNNSGFPIKCHEKFRILKAKIRQWR